MTDIEVEYVPDNKNAFFFILKIIFAFFDKISTVPIEWIFSRMIFLWYERVGRFGPPLQACI